MVLNASILIPVFNGETYLTECLVSVFDSIGNLKCEVVVVDDGSTDTTPNILNKFSRLHENLVVLTQANSGIEAALNAGLKECSADIVLRMDSDDVMLQHRVERQVQILTENKDISWTSGGAFLMDGGGKILATSWAPASHRILSCLDNHNFIIHPSVAFRKSSVLSVGGYQKTKRFHEDVHLWKKLKAAGKQYMYVPEPIINYRISSASTRLDSEQDAVQKLARTLVYNGARIEALRQLKFLSVRYKIKIFIMIFFPICFWRWKMVSRSDNT